MYQFFRSWIFAFFVSCATPTPTQIILSQLEEESLNRADPIAAQMSPKVGVHRFSISRFHRSLEVRPQMGQPNLKPCYQEFDHDQESRSAVIDCFAKYGIWSLGAETKRWILVEKQKLAKEITLLNLQPEKRLSLRFFEWLEEWVARAKSPY